MQQVTAYEDSGGRLHRTKRAAVEAEFITMVQAAWGLMPRDTDRTHGDPVVIARLLAAPNYEVRQALMGALLFLEEHKGDA